MKIMRNKPDFLTERIKVLTPHIIGPVVDDETCVWFTMDAAPYLNNKKLVELNHDTT